jgi:hypothetical protein
MSAYAPTAQDVEVIRKWERTFAGVPSQKSMDVTLKMILGHIVTHNNAVITADSMTEAATALKDAIVWDVPPPPTKDERLLKAIKGPQFQMDSKGRESHAARESHQQERQATIAAEMNDVNSQSFRTANAIAEAEVSKIRSSYCVVLPSGRVDHGRTQDRRKILNEIVAFSKQLDENGQKVRNYLAELRFIQETALPAFQREDEHRNYA